MVHAMPNRLLSLTALPLFVGFLVPAITRGDDAKDRPQRVPPTRPAAIVLTSVPSSGGRPLGSRVRRYGVTRRDLRVIQALRNVRKVIPFRELSPQARYGYRKSHVRLIGTTPDAAGVLTFALARGRFFRERESRTHNNVAIIGHKVAGELFPNTKPLGKSVLINGHYYLVIGTLKPGGGDADSESGNEVYVPLKTMRVRHGSLSINVSDDALTVEQFDTSWVIVTVRNPGTLAETGADVRRAMRTLHGSKRDYGISTTSGTRTRTKDAP